MPVLLRTPNITPAGPENFVSQRKIQKRVGLFSDYHLSRVPPSRLVPRRLQIANDRVFESRRLTDGKCSNLRCSFLLAGEHVDLIVICELLASPYCKRRWSAATRAGVGTRTDV